MRLGTRGSRLALTQARLVAERIRAKSPGIGIELAIIRTSGDERSEFGDEVESEVGEFSSELERKPIVPNPSLSELILNGPTREMLGYFEKGRMLIFYRIVG